MSKSLLYLTLAALFSVSLIGCGGDEPSVEPGSDTPTETKPEEEIPQPTPEPTPEPSPDTRELKYRTAQLSIDTKGVEIKSKEVYVKCTVTIDADGDEWDFTASAGVRGRGNSTWLWYDKKPYRIKLDKKAPLMGMGEGKSWVLLANYRDPTDLMNTFVFELGELCGMPYTNHTRYVELSLNGQYNGLYQLTEQVQQGKGRVNVDEKSGYLICLDADDGPELSPNATDNFWSSVYRMPVCVKNPEDQTKDQLFEIKKEFGVLENAIHSRDYTLVKQLMSVDSFIDFLIIQELIYNVELAAPRSMYMHRGVGEKWCMGPLWDFDAGYDFDWSNMYTGHNFFANHKELILGTNPATHAGTSYRVPEFFTDLFRVAEFKQDYKARWQQVKAMIPTAWENSMSYVDDTVWQREEDIWNIRKSYSNEISRMRSWIFDRVDYIDKVIENY